MRSACPARIGVFTAKRGDRCPGCARCRPLDSRSGSAAWFRKRPDQVSGRALHLAAIEPLVIVLRLSSIPLNYWHDRVGFDGNDREALQPVPGRTLPCVPESGEGIDRLVAQGEAETYLVGLAPLEVPRYRHQAAAFVERSAPKAAPLQIVRAGIEGSAGLIDADRPRNALWPVILN
jgi:hypothetical protein